MKNIEYIIVGDGYAALFFAHQLINNNKNFVVFSEGKKSASQVSAGIVNPVVLKKFTTFWLAWEQIDSLKQSLSEIENYTGKHYLIQQPIHRIFHDEQERNLWSKKSERLDLAPFLDNNFVEIGEIINPYQSGKVNLSARLDVTNFFNDFLIFLKNENRLISEKFDYALLNPSKNCYQDFHYQYIVFCEGMGVIDNPLFSNIPVHPNKGHHLKVHFPDGFREQVTIKKKHFLFPINESEYYYGGTYDRDQLHHEIDDSAKLQLVNGLKEFYPNAFDIKEINFGFRPTVKDRRPILGNHDKYKNLYVFNGLGARGILNGNYFAKELFEHIEFAKPLPAEVDLKRFLG